MSNSRLIHHCFLALLAIFTTPQALAKDSVKAIYIPLADHYAGVVAYEKYRDQMDHADFTIERMKNWDLLRAYFMSGEVDMAFVMSPLAMDMFHEDPMFRWVGLMHRDGNALAINDKIKALTTMPPLRIDRKPTSDVANAFATLFKQTKTPIEIGMPHLLATHSVVTYKYFKDHNYSIGIDHGPDKMAVIISIAPPKAPAFLKRQNNKGKAAAFEQSLPWADVVETQNFGHVAWYSKDVLPWPKGHVECIILVTDKAIKEKYSAIKEVIEKIHQAGVDIEKARREGPKALSEIAGMVRKHIPEHNEEAIHQSLRLDLGVINYLNLNTDKPGLKMIMDLAVEGEILKAPINIEKFVDESFHTKLTTQQLKPH